MIKLQFLSAKHWALIGSDLFGSEAEYCNVLVTPLLSTYRLLYPRGVLDKGSDGGVRKLSLHPVPCRIKNGP